MVQYRPSEGVFLEKGGADSSYQAVAALNLQVWLLYFPDRKREAAANAAVRWELGRVGADGQVDVTGNTRTGLGQERWMGHPKEVDLSEITLCLLYDFAHGPPRVARRPPGGSSSGERAVNTSPKAPAREATNHSNSVILSAAKNLASLAIQARFFAAPRMTVVRACSDGGVLPKRAASGLALARPGYRPKPTKKLKNSDLSPGCQATGKAKSRAIGAGPIAGTQIRRPKPGATR